MVQLITARRCNYNESLGVNNFFRGWMKNIKKRKGTKNVFLNLHKPRATEREAIIIRWALYLPRDVGLSQATRREQSPASLSLIYEKYIYYTLPRALLKYQKFSKIFFASRATQFRPEDNAKSYTSGYTKKKRSTLTDYPKKKERKASTQTSLVD